MRFQTHTSIFPEKTLDALRDYGLTSVSLLTDASYVASMNVTFAQKILGGVPLHRCGDGVAGRPSCMAGTAFYPQSSWHCSCHPQEGKVERSMTPRRGFWQHPLPSWPGERAEMGRPATESIDRGPGLH